MPVPFADAVDDANAQAADKAALLRSPVRYLTQAALAGGAYVGVAVVLLASVAGPTRAGTAPVAATPSPVREPVAAGT